jgi:hypothetical protein
MTALELTMTILATSMPELERELERLEAARFGAIDLNA